MNILLLKNNLTEGAVTNQFIDLSYHLSKNHTVYTGALLGEIDDSAAEALKDNGVLTINFSPNNASTFTVGKNLYRFLNENDIDVISTHLIRADVIGRVIATFSDTPIIVSTLHKEHSEHTLKQRLAKGLTLPLADGVVSVSNAVRNSLPEWIVALTQFTIKDEVIYNSVNIDMFESPPTHVSDDLCQHFENSDPTIVSVGRLIPIKNHEVLVDSIVDLINIYPDLKLILIGDGDRRTILEQRVEKQAISDNVIFTGWISRPQVAACIAAADVFAMPSRSEGFGVALIEAMATGTPVIVSDIPVFHEVASNTVLFASPERTDDWVEKINECLSNEESSNKRADTALERTRETFRPSQISQEYIEFFEMLLNN